MRDFRYVYASVQVHLCKRFDNNDIDDENRYRGWIIVPMHGARRTIRTITPKAVKCMNPVGEYFPYILYLCIKGEFFLAYKIKCMQIHEIIS